MSDTDSDEVYLNEFGEVLDHDEYQDYLRSRGPTQQFEFQNNDKQIKDSNLTIPRQNVQLKPQENSQKKETVTQIANRLQNQKIHLEGQLMKEQHKFKDFQKDQKVQTEQLMDKITNLTQKNDGLNAVNRELDQQVNRQQSQIDQLEETVLKLQKKISKTKKKQIPLIEKIKDQETEHLFQMQDLEKQFDAMKTIINDSENQIRQLQGNKFQLETYLNNQTQELQQLKELKPVLTLKERQLLDWHNDNQQLQSRICHLEGTLDSLSIKYQQEQKKNHDLLIVMDQNKTKDLELTKKEMIINGINSDISNIKQSYELQIQAKQNEIEQLRAEISNIRHVSEKNLDQERHKIEKLKYQIELQQKVEVELQKCQSKIQNQIDLIDKKDEVIFIMILQQTILFRLFSQISKYFMQYFYSI